MVRIAERPLATAATVSALSVMSAGLVPATVAAEDPSRTPGTSGEPAKPIRWHIDPARAGGEHVNVTAHDGSIRIRDTRRGFANGQPGRTYGSVTFQPRSLGAAVSRVRVTLDARVPTGSSVRAEIRGRPREDGGHGWSEWRVARPEAPAVPPGRSQRVQVRLTLSAARGSAGPAVSRLNLSADTVSTMRQAPGGNPRTYTVFATREGLVGKTTANGHVIEPRDHFVALPSSRALAPEGTGDYSVRVCSPETERCAFAPVWDTGPWNVGDDYWNPASVRANWTDLPQGTPQAQAAYEDGYNDGKDGSGRRVRNPAGIDLADGTFRDGLGLSDNGWVEVTYLWTGTYPATARVATARGPLRLRAAPHTGSAVKGLAARHSTIPVYCQVRGERVTGSQGSSDLWNKVGPGMYVSDAFTRTGTSSRRAERC